MISLSLFYHHNTAIHKNLDVFIAGTNPQELEETQNII